MSCSPLAAHIDYSIFSPMIGDCSNVLSFRYFISIEMIIDLLGAEYFFFPCVCKGGSILAIAISFAENGDPFI